jgi:hypothetical protein
MTPRHSFARAAVFAAVAAAATLPALALLVGPLGLPAALGLWLGVVAAGHLALVAPRGAPGLAVAGLTAAAAVLLVVARVPLRELALGLALAIAGGRTLLYRARPARALCLEVILVAGGLALARLFVGPTPASLALAIWAFLLVQSLFLLVPGPTPRHDRTDPFDEACAHLESLLEGNG